MHPLRDAFSSHYLFLKAIAAVDRAIVAWLERNLAITAAFSADCIIHLLSIVI